ncbi:Thioredoxin domain-containing protein 9 [Camelus dromedarius]|uniref:Thioredoxin domain-containing protein 9 n=1 Tax=Camelus dromedarius TaxID=9838 RepID=A0A5N4CD37_CAMDR|nr:Thioredoxin domain-containing protein 9 [Camelus dromedarius]KAB1256806.1 Thioredoxin domain-containing protein 9 [Camelus dromedarius]
MEATASVDMFSKVLENQLLQTTKLVEEHLDSEIQKLDQMDEDELERLKEKRLEALRKAQQQKQEWLSKGHGEYREIPSERDFFQEVKESKKVVCHFYRDSTFSHSTGDGANNLNPSSKFGHFLTSSSQGDSGLTKPFTRSTVGTARFGLEGEESDFSETNPGLQASRWRQIPHKVKMTQKRCKILDRHLVILSKKHLETKFLKLNVEKAPFLCERLRIKVIPTLALVKDGKTQDFVVGFSDLGNTDDFSTETLEWRLGCSDILNYSGSLMEPPFQSQKKFGTNFTKLEKKTIRGKKYDSDSDDD